MVDPRLSTSASEYYVESSSTKRVVFGSRALTNDTEPGLVNYLRKEKVSIKPPVTEGIILSRCRYLKPKCRVRKVSSKAAVLVLVWNVLFCSTFGFLNNLEIVFLSNNDLISTIVSGVAFVLLALLSGYIADNFIGRYRSAKIAFTLLFATSILQCILVVVKQSIAEVSLGWRIGLVTFTSCLGCVSTAILLVTLPQFGLDQMTDNSVSNITSFISWFVASYFFGRWISGFSYTGWLCFGSDFQTVWSLLSVGSMSIVLISDFFLAPKWLIIEPNSPQSIKTIYRVLKYAAKHKAPTNRSSFTYWEEDVPSRIDLGKMKYGGPFTVEQVEDVKTLLRILALTAPLWLCFFPFQMQSSIIYILKADPIFLGNVTDATDCYSHVIMFFTYYSNLLPALFLVVHELVVFPLIGHLTPSSIRRIGVSFLLIVITSFFCVLICVYFYFHHDVHIALAYIHSLSVAITLSILYPSFVEFVSAQSPYNMRGLLQGYGWCTVIFSSSIAWFINVESLFSFSKDRLAHVMLIYSSVAFAVTLVGLVLFCLLARWYKRRERDDIVSVHTLVEEVYDRYISNRSVF